MGLFGVFGWLGFSIAGWRRQAISELDLRPGDTVVDIGCGTGLNFPMLYEAVGPKGAIIGVDLSEAMLFQAHQTVAANHWDNVHPVCADTRDFEFPSDLDAVLSTYALILMPDPERVIAAASESRAPSGRFVVIYIAVRRKN